MTQISCCIMFIGSIFMQFQTAICENKLPLITSETKMTEKLTLSTEND